MKQLQLAYARKQLTPGLNIKVDAPKVFVNDQDGLQRKYDDIYLKMNWIERMDVTIEKKEIDEDQADKDTETGKAQMVDNDFKRESLL